MSGAGVRPDWRDAHAYRALAGMDGAGLAWEWVRRDPLYGEAWAAAGVSAAADARLLEETPFAARWGLHFRGKPVA